MTIRQFMRLFLKISGIITATKSPKTAKRYAKRVIAGKIIGKL